jgi:phytoene dehydrogenase-like protein
MLEEWFESEPLRATLGTDAVIGAFASPASPGTGYVLFHHVMGSVTGHRGVWAYVAGGIGALCDAIAASAREAGATIRTAADVVRVRVENARATGVVLSDGAELDADLVVSSADPARTFFVLVGAAELPAEFVRAAARIDYRSPVFKMNLALSRLPRFRVTDRDSAPQLSGTIHVGSENLDAIDRAFEQACAGDVCERPVVEMTIPSVLDATLAPAGSHVASIFAQYAPALSSDDPRWGAVLERARERILAVVEEVAPGFTESILHSEILGPPELERLFGLTGGNIFHGAMTPDRLLFLRPMAGWARYRTPIRGLYLCGAGTHPGGGIMGACGRNAAFEIITDRVPHVGSRMSGAKRARSQER